MNSKEELVLQEIINYVNKNNRMPTLRYLQNKLNYKSINSITEYLKSLEKQNYLTRNKENKLILSKYNVNSNIKTIEVINSKNTFVRLILDKSEKYLAYKINHNYFIKDGIYKNDLLIIKINKKLKDNDFGLFIIDNKYRIMKYSYKDGFYILTDKEELVLNRVKIIGKVIMVEKNF